MTAEVRAINPALESKTMQGSSLTSRVASLLCEAAADVAALVTLGVAPSRNWVRRGVAKAAFAPANSVETTSRKRSSSVTMACRSSMDERSSSASASSSIRLNFVRRRRGMSRM